ncbi:HAD-IC family P-type ATPase, partial [Crocosphaera sp. Alani8]|uniref:HAD-IC family P-type ATPase n=1 Tax=Crocosphaera sp. Alani8 TaxID=3038952 RepID=UPI00313ED553
CLFSSSGKAFRYSCPHASGKAITQAALQKNFQLQNASQVQAKTGLGIVGEVAGKTIKVGKATFIRQEIPHLNHELVQINKRLEKQGKTVVWVVENEKVIGSIAVADAIRPEAAASIKELKEMGIEQIVLLTGDNQVTANSVAESLGIEMVHAELLPEDKLTVIRQLQRKYQNVAMVGDGINDAPALAMATVGIAMGGAGNDVALETADVILMSDRLEKISQAISLGRRANRIIKQNITFALSFIFLLLIGNFTGNINMPLGVIGHEGSTVLVTISGLRLLR